MKKNTTTMWVVALIVVGGAMFFAGSKYGASQVVPSNQAGQYGNGQGGTRRAGGQGGRGMMGGFTSGEILSKDDKSVTLKMRDGGSKLVFFTANTKVLKSTEGSMADLKVGDTVSTNGSANPDGSINAESIQQRPPMPTPATTTTK